MSVPTEPGFWKEVTHGVSKILEVFTKPLSVVSDAVSKRLEILLRRKPRLFVKVRPMTSMWCIARSGNEKIMQMMFEGEFTHDDPDQTLILIDAYLKGTKPKLDFHEQTDINPEELVTHHVSFWLTPVIGKEGEDWTGNVIFLDQFHRKYTVKKVVFKWAGLPPKKAN